MEKALSFHVCTVAKAHIRTFFSRKRRIIKLSFPAQAKQNWPSQDLTCQEEEGEMKNFFFLVAKSVSLCFPCREDLESIFIIIAV